MTKTLLQYATFLTYYDQVDETLILKVTKESRIVTFTRCQFGLCHYQFSWKESDLIRF